MAHVHEKDGNYLIEQLCTIGACGALGGVAIMMWMNPDGLNFLGLQFQKPFDQPSLSPVLWGGTVIVFLVMIRAIAVWFSVGTRSAANAHEHALPTCAHEHGHDHPPCDHAHGVDQEHKHAGPDVHAHPHGHGHHHGWAPWRYVLLLVPVGLYTLNLIPSAVKGHDAVDINVNPSGRTVVAKGGDVIHAFLELERASATPDLRKQYEGRTAQVIGQVDVQTDSRRFGLIRYKVGCCVPDAIQLNLVVEVQADSIAGKNFNAQSLRGEKRNDAKWVDVTGIIQFRTLRGTEHYVTVLVVDAKNLKVIAQPSNPYVY